MPIHENIYKAIREKIVLGKLMPGERITEAELAQKFSCSRSPVREALARLEKEGYLEILPRRGAVATKISPQEVSDYYALLSVLEGKAVEWAAPRLKPEDLDRLEAINQSMKNISADSGSAVEDWVELNWAFHQMFRVGCGNLKMDWLVQEIRARITRSLYTSLMVPVFDDYIVDHALIIQRLREGDAAQARQAMEMHILRAQQVLDRFFSLNQHA